MSWNELTKDNIEYVKELYYDYLENYKRERYVNSNDRMSFEEFMDNEITLCEDCKTPIVREYSIEKLGITYYVCPDCYDYFNSKKGE